MVIEWIVTTHARERMHERLGVDVFDAAHLAPRKVGRDGLRLWAHTAGGFVLVREDLGSGWAKLTAVSAMTLAVFEAKQARNLVTPMPIPDALLRAVKAERAIAPASDATRAVYWAVLQCLGKHEGPMHPLTIAAELGEREDWVSSLIGELGKHGLAERASRARRMWVITPQGRAAIKRRSA